MDDAIVDKKNTKVNVSSHYKFSVIFPLVYVRLLLNKTLVTQLFALHYKTNTIILTWHTYIKLSNLWSRGKIKIRFARTEVFSIKIVLAIANMKCKKYLNDSVEINRFKFVPKVVLNRIVLQKNCP